MNRLDQYSLAYNAFDNNSQISYSARKSNHHHIELNEFQHHNRSIPHQTTPPALMPSPPELLHDSGEDESDDEMMHDHAITPPYLSSLPVSVLRQKESSIRSNSKPCGSFEDSGYRSIQQFGSTHLLATSRRQNHLPAHRKLSSSPEESPNNRRKSVPHRSPAAIHDALQATALDQSTVFQLNPFDHDSSFDLDNIESKVICGETLLTALRTRVTSARHERSRTVKHASPRHRPMVVAHKIQIPRSPKSQKRRKSPEAVSPSELANAFTDMSVDTSHSDDKSHRRGHAFDYRSQLENFDEDDEEISTESTVDLMESEITSDKTPSPSASHRSKSKGPCQACQEVSDGCMRKGFNWPFEASLIYYDKGKPFVYLCNKCGLR